MTAFGAFRSLKAVGLFDWSCPLRDLRVSEGMLALCPNPPICGAHTVIVRQVLGLQKDGGIGGIKGLKDRLLAEGGCR